jgi:hypothetical protein
VQPEDAGKAAAQAAGELWDRARGELVNAGVADQRRLTDELLLLLYFAGHASIHIALFGRGKLKKRVQVGYTLAWDRFAREKSSTVDQVAGERLQEYSRSLRGGGQAGSGGAASVVAMRFCRFLECRSPQAELAAASLFNEQVTATMHLIRKQLPRA